ncbi:MAG: hypothetical protein RLZZ153_194 [Pseudomonadota bacterium]|jgi:hypothetical protein
MKSMSASNPSAKAAANPFGSLPWGLPAGLNPLSQGGPSVPGLDEINDFMRQAWGSMNLSPSLAPTLDLQELDKRIADLKAVEQWLLLNLNMLRGSIQALEVQRATVATLRAFSEAALSPSGPGAQATAPSSRRNTHESSQAPPEASAKPRSSGKSADSTRSGRAARSSRAKSPKSAEPMLEAATAWWQMLNAQFEQVSQAALNPSSTPAKAADKSRPSRSKAPRRTAAGARSQSRQSPS